MPKRRPHASGKAIAAAQQNNSRFAMFRFGTVNLTLPGPAPWKVIPQCVAGPHQWVQPCLINDLAKGASVRQAAQEGRDLEVLAGFGLLLGLGGLDGLGAAADRGRTRRRRRARVIARTAAEQAEEPAPRTA